jgi:hypothetical protein
VDLYTLTPTFLAADPVDEFISAIWTERFSKHGDTQIVLPATAKNIDMLREGTYLALRGSKEVMELETQNIEDQKLTVVGKTLDHSILMQRYIWALNATYNATNDPLEARVSEYTDKTRKPGAFISHLVDRFVINPTVSASPAALDFAKEKILELALGEIDATGDVQRLTAALGPVYPAIEGLAEQFKVGFSLYLHSADAQAGYALRFKTYKGQDRSSTQNVNELVRLTPELDGISDIKEIRSNAKFKNVVYVFYQGTITKHLLDPTQPEPEGLERRVLVHDAVGTPVGRQIERTNQWWYGGYGGYGSQPQTYVGPTEIAAFREQNAKDAFANHNYIRSIDGKTSPISEYKFGEDYGLGDIIELEGLTGAVSKAQITEYIRSQDKNGETEYPTISVVT